MAKKRKLAGIYTITIPSGRVYVGSSINLQMRRYQHLHSLRKNRHENKKLTNAYRKYGEEGLKFDIIFCLLDNRKILEIEQYFLDELKPDLNMTKFAGSPMSDPEVAKKTANTLRTCEKCIAIRKRAQACAAKAVSKKVVRLTDGMTFESGQAAARFMGYTKRPADITTAARNKTRCRSGHFWIFEGSTDTLEMLEAHEKVMRDNMRTSLKRARDASKAKRESGISKKQGGAGV